MYKEIYEEIKQIIFYPAKAWKEIEKNGFEKNVQKNYIYPLIVATTIAVILGQIWITSFDIQMIIKVGFITFISYFISFFASIFLLGKFIEKKYEREIDLKKIKIFVAYSSTLMLVMNMIVGLIPVDMFFLKVFNIYTAYIVLQGAYILDIKEEEQNTFVLVTTIIILLCPYIVEKLLTFLMPGMKL